MKSNNRYFAPLLFALLFVVLAIVLQLQMSFNLFAREQDALFVWDGAAAWELTGRVGGIALFVARFVTQFFVVPYLGAVVTAGVLAGAAWLLWLAVKRLPHAPFAVVVCALPSVLGLVAIDDANCLYQSLVALLLLCLSLMLISTIRFERTVVDVVWVGLLGVVLYFAAGSVAVVFVVTLAVADWRRWRSTLAAAVLTAVAIGVSVHTTLVDGWRFALLPDLYYQPQLSATAVVWAMFLSIPVVVVLSRLSGLARKWPVWTQVVVGVACVACMVVAGVKLSDNKAHKNYNSISELQYYADNGHWDKIIDRCRGVSNNLLFSAYRNLALSARGELLEHLFDYYQHGLNSLVVDNATNSKDVSHLLSDIYFMTGSVAASQNEAFESNCGCQGNNPTLIKRLVQTNLIEGAYGVADRYLSLLDKTIFYRKWAARHRVFLYNDQAVEKDKLLGVRRNDLTAEGDFTNIHGFLYDTWNIVAANPDADHRCAMEYLVAGLLLDKELNGLREFLTTFGSTALLSNPPTVLQQAVIGCAETDRDYCVRHGVTEQTFARYELYKRQFVECRNRQANPAVQMRSSFGNTFWYYLMFSN